MSPVYEGGAMPCGCSPAGPCGQHGPLTHSPGEGAQVDYAPVAKKLAEYMKAISNGSVNVHPTQIELFLEREMPTQAGELKRLREALRAVNDLQHRIAIELDTIPQQPRIEHWTRQIEQVIERALAAPPSREGTRDS